MEKLLIRLVYGSSNWSSGHNNGVLWLDQHNSHQFSDIVLYLKIYLTQPFPVDSVQPITGYLAIETATGDRLNIPN